MFLNRLSSTIDLKLASPVDVDVLNTVLSDFMAEWPVFGHARCRVVRMDRTDVSVAVGITDGVSSGLCDVEFVVYADGLRMECLYALVDTSSWAIAARYILHEYRQRLAGEKGRLALMPYVGDFRRRTAISDDLTTYWQQELVNVADVFSFPVKVGAGQRYTAGSRALPVEMLHSVERLADVLDVSTSSIFMACLFVVLHRLYNTTDILVSANVNGRQDECFANLAGPVDQYAPFRKIMSAGSSFLKLCKSVDMQYAFREAFVEYDLFRSIPEQVHAAVDGLIENIIFSHNRLALDSRESHALQLSGVYPQYQLDVVEVGDGIIVQYRFDSLVLEDFVGVGIADAFIACLTDVVAAPETRISDIGLLSAAAEQQVLYAFNDHTVDFDLHAPIPVLFESIVTSRPGDVAVIHQEVALRYDEVNRRANQIAHALRGLGAKPNEFVGVYMPRNASLLVSLLGILKAGAAFVAFDVGNPDDRTKLMMKNSQVKIVLTDAKTLEQEWNLFEGVETLTHIISIETIFDSLPARMCGNARILDYTHVSGQSSSNPANVNSITDWAYLLYTSGSTGEPKGAITRHDGALNHIFSEFRLLGLRDGFRFLQSANIASDISIWQLLAPLLKGGATVIIDYEDLLDFAAVERILDAHRVDIVEFVPSYIAELLPHLEQRAGQNPSLVSLSVIMMVGEEVPGDLVYRWLKAFPHTKVVNGYGPCEASDDIAQFMIDHPVLLAKVPIGIPLDNLTIFVVDPSMKLMPIGFLGEICVSGVGVGAGYWNDREKTDAKFVPNIFAGTLGDIIYKTGDLGRWLPDGNLEFYGRIDSQLKIRGFRVEISEIENVFRAFPGIVDVAVHPYKEGSNADYLLSAFCIVDQEIQRDGYSELGQAFRRFLRSKLPEYMVPSRFVLVESFPVNLSGKVKRGLLAGLPGIALDRVYVAPRTDHERTLVQLWQEILGIDSVSIQDNFFDIGGNSLRAVSIVSRIHRAIGKAVTLRDVFLYPVLMELAAFLDGGTATVYDSIPTLPEQPFYALSDAQERIWISSQLSDASRAYNVPIAFELEGLVDIDRLKHSFDRLVDRHEILRTVFGEHAGVPHQRVLERTAIGFSLDVVDATSYTEAEVRQVVMSDATAIFDLNRGPLFSVKLLRQAAERHVLVINAHHIIIDGWSEQVLIHDLLVLYHYVSGQGRGPEPLRIQYKDYAAWHLERLTRRLTGHRAYWLGQFSGRLPVLNFPLDYARPALQVFEASVLNFHIDRSDRQRLAQLAHKAGASTYMALLGVSAVLLYQATGQSDLVIGSAVSGRDHIDLESQIGCYLNTLAVRLTFSAEESFMSLLATIKAQVLGAFEHQLYPFQHLVTDLQLTSDKSRNPLFDFGLTYNAIDPAGDITVPSSLKVKEYTTGFQSVKSDLWIHAFETPEGMAFSVEYNTSLFKAHTLQLFVEDFKKYVSRVLSEPQASVQKLTDDVQKTKAELNKQLQTTLRDKNLQALKQLKH